MDVFESVQQSDAQSTGTENTSPESNNTQTQEVQSTQSDQAAQQAAVIHELEKLGKFKFEGREMTLEDFKKERMLQKDYTFKTQKIAEERKTFEKSREFSEKLHLDLDFVKNNPKGWSAEQLVSAFVKTYPKEYHPLLRFALSEQAQQSSQSESQASKPSRSVDIDLLSRLHSLERSVEEDKIAKNTMTIESNLEKFGSKFPDVPQEEVLAKIINLQNEGKEISEKDYEKAFQEINDKHEAIYRARYKKQIESQTSANKKAASPPAGGGTPGRAPQKFKSIDEVSKYADSIFKPRAQ